MNVTTIDMPVDEAKAKLKSIRRQLHRRADAEYEQCAKGYAAFARGTPLIKLTDTIIAGGFDEQHRPRLAFARADRRRVRLFWACNSTELQFDSRERDRGGRRSMSLVHKVDVGISPRDRDQHSLWSIRAEAVVPMVPADSLEAAGLPSLKSTYILWEADWEAVPVDPMLLRQRSPPMYAVLAQWDLTELERAVMAGRLA